MDPAVRDQPGEPDRCSASPGNLPIVAHRNLERYPGPATNHAADKRRVEPPRLVFEHTDFDLDAMLAQQRQAAAAHERVGILHRDHGTADAGLDDARSAGAGPADVTAGLEGAVQRRATRT